MFSEVELKMAYEIFHNRRLSEKRWEQAHEHVAPIISDILKNISDTDPVRAKYFKHILKSGSKNLKQIAKELSISYAKICRARAQFIAHYFRILYEKYKDGLDEILFLMNYLSGDDDAYEQNKIQIKILNESLKDTENQVMPTIENTKIWQELLLGIENQAKYLVMNMCEKLLGKLDFPTNKPNEMEIKLIFPHGEESCKIDISRHIIMIEENNKTQFINNKTAKKHGIRHSIKEKEKENQDILNIYLKYKLGNCD